MNKILYIRKADFHKKIKTSKADNLKINIRQTSCKAASVSITGVFMHKTPGKKLKNGEDKPTAAFVPLN